MANVDAAGEIENQKVTAGGAERPFHVVETDVGFGSCDHAHHDSLWAAP